MPFCRIAPSLGALEGDPNEVWGTQPYYDKLHRDEPTVFFGLYGLPDFYTLWRHRGKKWILWAGSDIRHFVSGYWLDDTGVLKVTPKPLAKWINTYCESWVENEVEQAELKRIGIYSHVCPSFMGNVEAYGIQYRPSARPRVYASVSGDDFVLYKWAEIDQLALNHPEIEFHLYGNTQPWAAVSSNVVVHGRVPKEQMNSETQQMQGGLRLLEFDGFSEVIAKSVLWGQWPISTIPYPHTLRVSEIGSLVNRQQNNLAGAVYYRVQLNKYPWHENN